MSTMDRMRSTQVSARAALLSIALFLLLAACVIVGIARFSGARSASESSIQVEAAKGGATTATGYCAEMASGEVDFGVIAKRDLFKSAPLPVPPPPPPPPPSGGQVGPMPVPPPTVELPKLAYTGQVELPAGLYALIEDTKTNDAVYARVGEHAFGCEVKEILPGAVILDYSGNTMNLQLGANKTEESGGGGGGEQPSTPTPPQPPTPSPAPEASSGQPTPQQTYQQRGPGWRGNPRNRMRPGPARNGN